MESESEEIENQIFYKCKRCGLIPLLSLQKNEFNEIFVKQTCENNHFELEEIENFLNNKKLNNDNNNFIINCKEHNQNYSNFCFDCKKNFCNVCLKNKIHSNHKIISLENLKYNKNEISEFKEKLKETKNVIEKIKLNYNNLKKYLENIQTKINKNYIKFINLNEESYNFAKNIFNIYNNKLNNLNYQIIINVKSILNFNNLNDYKNKITDFNSFINFLNDTFILKAIKISNNIHMETEPDFKKKNINENNHKKYSKSFKQNSLSKLKKDHLNNITNQNFEDLNENFISDPFNLTYNCDLTDQSKIYFPLNNQFCLFHSEFNIIYLIYYNNDNYSLEIIDINNKKLIKSFSLYHSNEILCIRHYNFENKDLILTSSKDNSIKILELTNVNNYNIILSIKNAHKDKILNENFFYINSVCLIYENKEIFILSTCENEKSIKMWNFYGKFLKKFCKLEVCNYIDNYYDDITDKNFIITLNSNQVKVYDFEGNIFQKYNCEGNYHKSVNIKKFGKSSLNLIVCSKEFIHIFDFYKGNLIKEILVEKNVNLFSICFWNETFFLVGTDKNILLYEYKTGKKIKEINVNNNINCYCQIQKIYLENYGECLIALSKNEGKIKLYNIKQNVK